MKDILTVIESQDITPKDKIKLEDKNLDQLTLPEIASVLNEIQTHIENNPEMSEDEEMILDKINMKAETKCMAWAYVVNLLQESIELNKHDIKFYESKIKAIKERNVVIENRIKSRMFRISEIMKSLGKKKLETANMKVSFRKQPEKVRFINDFPNHYKYRDLVKFTPGSYNFDLNKLKKYLKSNESEDFELYRESDKLVIK